MQLLSVGDGSCRINVRLNGPIGSSVFRPCERTLQGPASTTGLTGPTLSRNTFTTVGPTRCSRLLAPGEWGRRSGSEERLPSARRWCFGVGGVLLQPHRPYPHGDPQSDRTTRGDDQAI